MDIRKKKLIKEKENQTTNHAERKPKIHTHLLYFGSSESETLTQRWEDQESILKSISSSLKEGPIRENHLTELRCVGRDLARDEIPDLKWVVKDAAEARSSKNGGIDPADQQVQSVLAKIDVVQDVTRLLRDEDEPSFLLSKGPRKRNAPEEGGDDVKSACPCSPGRHTCYNGQNREPRPREGKLTSETRSRFRLLYSRPAR